jgi:hypothetical protein
MANELAITKRKKRWASRREAFRIIIGGGMIAVYMGQRYATLKMGNGTEGQGKGTTT